MVTKTCCITGHREFADVKLLYIMDSLKAELLRATEDNYTHFISGFAQGIDLIFAELVLDMKKNSDITLEAAIPYKNRIQNKCKKFQNLLKNCDKISIISDEYYKDCFLVRNKFMVEHSQRVIAVYNGLGRSGTAMTVRYAEALNRDLRIIKI